MKVISIAEIGVNHFGLIEKAKRMIQKAADCGATYAKGQMYDPVRVLGRTHPALAEAQWAQFTKRQHEELAVFGNQMGIKYFVSVFDINDIPWAAQFGVFKIASRMNQNQEFIDEVDKQNLPTFMSVQPMKRAEIPLRFKLMWCVTNYPSSKKEVLSYPYSDQFGLSSHCPDPSATLEAVQKGARVIENHVAESHEELGCDISSSLDFKQYAQLLKTIHVPKKSPQNPAV